MRTSKFFLAAFLLLIWHEYKIHSVRPELVEGHEALHVSTSSTRTASYYLLAGSIIAGIAYIWAAYFNNHAVRYVYFPGLLLLTTGIAMRLGTRDASKA